jgi:hypothetical protein
VVSEKKASAVRAAVSDNIRASSVKRARPVEMKDEFMASNHTLTASNTTLSAQLSQTAAFLGKLNSAGS